MRRLTIGAVRHALVLGDGQMRPDFGFEIIVIETTGLGAAYLAGHGAGLWPSLDAVAERHAVERTFTPAMRAAQRAEQYENWKRAVERSRDWTRSAR